MGGGLPWGGSKQFQGRISEWEHNIITLVVTFIVKRTSYTKA